MLAALPGLVLALNVAALGPQPVKLSAADGTAVFGTFHDAGDKTRPLILLFHQAGSNQCEYATIAPALREMGFNALTIDQRSGDQRFLCSNITAAARGGSTDKDYLAALPDLEAALAWARAEGFSGQLIAWGSSYSAALVFLLAAQHPGEVHGVIAMSPGEYLGEKGRVAAAAQKTTVPTLIMAPPKEAKQAQALHAAVAARHKALHTPARAVHGSSMLIATQSEDSARHWRLVGAFLERFRHRPGEGCTPIQARFLAVLTAADGRCQSKSDCSCYNPVAPGLSCGGITDAPTARWLGAIQTSFRADRCPWPINCEAWRCDPQCEAGRCKMGPNTDPSGPESIEAPEPIEEPSPGGRP